MTWILSRRAFGLSLLSALGPSTKWTLGFSTYGMPKWTTEKALDQLASIGFDSLELAVMPDRDAAPERMSSSRRKEIRKRLGDQGLALTALMENLTPSPLATPHAQVRERLSRVADLAHDLALDRPPLIETVLGGGKWETVRGLYRDRLGEWLRVLASRRLVLAIKPHRFGAMSLPDHAVWLIEQLGRLPWLRLVYDHSHYALRGQEMDKLVASAAGYTAFVAVKDVAQRDGKAVFLLPGETNQIDYVKLFGLLAREGYQGDVNCEVSGMISSRAEYDPVMAARTCYRHMSNALAKAGLRKAKTP